MELKNAKDQAQDKWEEEGNYFKITDDQNNPLK
jgi:hypothetical protein